MIRRRSPQFRWRFWALLGIVVLTGGIAVTWSVPGEPPETRAGSVRRSTDVGPITVYHTEQYNSKPPQYFIHLDIHARNESTRARWLLVPTSTWQMPTQGLAVDLDPANPPVLGRRVFGAKLRRWGGVGFYAIWLPGGGDVWVRDVVVCGDFRNEVRSRSTCKPSLTCGLRRDTLTDARQVRIEAVLAEDLRVDAEDPREWFDGGVDVAADEVWSQSQGLTPPGDSPTPVLVDFDERERYTLVLTLDDCCAPILPHFLTP